MNHHRLLYLAYGALFLSLLGCTAGLERRSRVPAHSSPDFDFTAFLDDSVYLTGQPIYVFLRLRNVSDSVVRDLNPLSSASVRLYRADDSTGIQRGWSCPLGFLSQGGLPLQPGGIDCAGFDLTRYHDPPHGTRTASRRNASLANYLGVPWLEPGRYRVEARYSVHTGYRRYEQVTLLTARPILFEVRPIESNPLEQARVAEFLAKAPHPDSREERMAYCLRRLREFNASRYFIQVLSGTGSRIKSIPVDTLLTWYREVACDDSERAVLLAYVRWRYPDFLEKNPDTLKLIDEFAFWERSRAIVTAWRNEGDRIALRARLVEAEGTTLRSSSIDAGLEHPGRKLP